MAIVQNFNIGHARKSLGNTTFSKQFGKNVLKTKAISVKDARTPRQLEQRAKFGMVGKLLSPMSRIIKAAYHGTHAVKGMSPYNKMVRYNLKKAVIGESIDWNKFEVCTNIGDSVIGNFAVNANPELIVQCSWAKNSSLQPELDSPIDAIVINRENLQVLIFKVCALRKDEIAFLNVPACWVGNTVSVYLQCLDFKGKENNRHPFHVIFNATKNLADVTILQ